MWPESEYQQKVLDGVVSPECGSQGVIWSAQSEGWCGQPRVEMAWSAQSGVVSPE